jgi:hypothetical protein
MKCIECHNHESLEKLNGRYGSALHSDKIM